MLKRRQFIKLGSMAGSIAGVSSLANSFSSAAGTLAPAASPRPSQSLASQLQRIAREFVTIPKEEARFLSILIKLSRARRVLEVGTAYGYTTLWLALALEETDGKLTTIEILPERVALARQHLAQVGLSHRVHFLQGDAHGLIPTLEGQFDLAYLDADKGGNGDYFSAVFPHKLAPGSLLVAHNAILLAESMEAYLVQVQNHPELDTLIVRAVEEDGLALSYRTRSHA